MLRAIKIAHIQVGRRHRKDLGNLQELARSIQQEALLQPIGVTDRLELVFGDLGGQVCPVRHGDKPVDSARGGVTGPKETGLALER